MKSFQKPTGGRFPPREAKEKAARYCAYQERSQRQVLQKLRDLGLDLDQAEEVLVELILEDFVNELRYAKAYARGHFYLKKWGRRKITHALKQEGVSSQNIADGLLEIDPEDYERTLDELANKKIGSLQSQSPLAQKAKLKSYLVQKGYEFELIDHQLKRLLA